MEQNLAKGAQGLFPRTTLNIKRHFHSLENQYDHEIMDVRKKTIAVK